MKVEKGDPITLKLSQFITGTNYEDLPQVVVAVAKRGVLDIIGVTLAGIQQPTVKCVHELAKEVSSCNEATVIGSGFQTSVTLAAWANGTAGHALDYDDCLHILPMRLGHPTTSVFPAVLAIAEKLNVSGKELITAYCQGVEVYAKIGLLCADAAHRKGWHNTSILGTMAAAGAAAKLLKLGELQVRRCFGVAASLANGLRQNFGTMVKPLHAGNAARNGVEAAMLAEKGFTACETILEAPLGFRSVFTGNHGDIIYGDRTVTVDELAKSLGNPWNIISPGLVVKLYPSCRGTHSAVDAALDLRQRYSIDWQQISEIECYVPSRSESLLPYHYPQTGLEGKFSLEYVLARTLMSGAPSIEDFTDSRVNEPAIKLLVSKVKWHPFDKPFGISEFVVKLNDGTKYSSRIEFPRGEPENQVSDEVVIAKYQDCAGHVLSQEVVSQIKELVLSLENVERVSQLTSLLRTN